MNAANGIAYDTAFEVSCSGWVTDSLSYPIGYEFHALDLNSDSGDLSQLCPYQTSSTLDFKSSDGDLQLWAIIKDQGGSSVIVEVDTYSVKIAGSSKMKLAKRSYSVGAQTAYNYITSSWTSFNQTSNANSALVAIAAVLTGIKSQCLSSTDVSRLEHFKEDHIYNFSPLDSLGPELLLPILDCSN